MSGRIKKRLCVSVQLNYRTSITVLYLRTVMCFCTIELSLTNYSAIYKLRCNRGKSLVMKTRDMNVRRNVSVLKRRILFMLEGNRCRLKQLYIGISTNLNIFLYF
jgi:hypothetical protein